MLQDKIIYSLDLVTNVFWLFDLKNDNYHEYENNYFIFNSGI